MEETKQVVAPAKVSKLAILRKLLADESGHTKQELSELTGLKLSTVNCQIYYHLPTKGFEVEKLADKKFRFVKEI
jgi:hypothetical protein